MQTGDKLELKDLFRKNYKKRYNSDTNMLQGKSENTQLPTTGQNKLIQISWCWLLKKTSNHPIMLISEGGEAASTSQEPAHQHPPPPSGTQHQKQERDRHPLLRHNGSPPSLFRHWNSHTYIHLKSLHLKVKHIASHFELKKFNFFRAPVPFCASLV